MTELWITPQLYLRDEDGYFSEGDGIGLLKLIRYDLPPGSPTTWSYFRHIGREFMMHLCHAQEVERKNLNKPFDALRPSAKDLSPYILNAPPMKGGEYLSPERLLLLHLELEKAVQNEFNTFKGTFSEYLRSLNAAWKNVGKVSFHLAENKNDTTGIYPFAFIATFIHRLSENDKPKQSLL